MKFEIKHIWKKNIIFSSEATSLKSCVEKAVKENIDLQFANLSGADLCGSYLKNACLSHADLNGANLNYASFYSADLIDANLNGADLKNANLVETNLHGASLSGADLKGANLNSACLKMADFNGADLSRADLSNADILHTSFNGANLCLTKGINKFLTTPLYLLQDQVGKIRAYKLTDEDGNGPYFPDITYQVGESYSVQTANCNENEQCAPGISLATLDWCLENWKYGYRIFVAEFTRKDIASIPIGSDGKFRVHKCKIVAEKKINL